MRKKSHRHITDVILSDTEDYYAVLGIHPSVVGAAVRLAHRARIALVHPDRCKHERAHQAAIAVNVANDVLGNAEKRRVYDELRKLKQQPPVCTGCLGAGYLDKVSQKGFKRTIATVPCPACNGTGLAAPQEYSV